jgi:glycerol dehydrogenase
LVDSRIKKSLTPRRIITQDFSGESSLQAVNAIFAAHRTKRPQAIIGVGGGKCLDTAKLVAWELSLPLITVPSSTATCACWTGIAPVYELNGAYSHTVEHTPPDGLILDSRLLASAPFRLRASGMVDALAKYYEPRDNQPPLNNEFSVAAWSLGDQLFKVIQSHGFDAQLKIRKSSPALEHLGHASTVLAGVVGEWGGKPFRHGLAHSLYGAWTHLGLTHQYLHGELVGLGLLIELTLAGHMTEYNRLKRWMNAWHLPTRLPECAMYQASQGDLGYLKDHMAKYRHFVPLTAAFLKQPLKALAIIQ